MKRLFFLVIALAWLTFSTTPVLACTCEVYGTPVCAVYWGSEAVFVGQLRAITPPPADRSPGTMPNAMLHFIVEQPFRGITTATVDVETFYGTTCDLGFVKGKRYLIYAERDSETKQLFAGPCNRNTELENAVEDLNYIRSLKEQGVAESIAGRVTRMKYEAIPGAKIEVRNENKNFETASDKDGSFSVSLPGPGTYTVRVLVPASMTITPAGEDPIGKVESTDALTTIEYKVELGKSQCNYRQFDLFPIDLHATAEISGNVLTTSGRPVEKGHVYLLKASDYDRYRYADLEANGFFKFANVAAGEYLLVLNPNNQAPGEYDAPHARAFYPNATDASDATKIVVSEGAKLENVTLRVRPAWKERTVSGRVVWPDGRPITDASVSLYNGDRHLRSIEVDNKGWFIFKVYGEFKYAIEANEWGNRPGKSARVALTDKSTNLTLVLKPK